MPHDPRRLIEALRDHLSRHDRPIAFLFGAGSSSAPRKVGYDEPLIPAIAQLTDLCEAAVKALGVDFERAWDVVAKESIEAEGNQFVEAILSRVRVKLEAIGEGETLAGLDYARLQKFESEIRRTIATSVQPADEIMPAPLPHHWFARWLGRAARQRPVELFTTNYDLLLERALEDERVAIFDGFVGSYRPFFSQESLIHAEAAPGTTWTRLWKIHGSVNWRWLEVAGTRRIVRTEPSPSGELILPSYRKYDESRKQPYIAILDRMVRFLSQDDALLLTSGYGFGDEHINDVIFDALGRPSRTHVVALQFSDPDGDSSLVATAERRPNLEVLGPTMAWVGTVRAPWLLSEPVTNATAPFLDVAFDSDAEPDPDKAGLTGRFMLGDFSRLARFLASMAEPASTDTI
jgi:hypothetical protein